MPLRFIPWLLSILIAVVSGLYCFMGPGGLHVWLLFALFLFFSWIGFRDLMQNQHAILHNYPLIGHLRFLFEFIRPEIRQYFLESDNEEIPFSGRKERWSTSAPRAHQTSDLLEPSLICISLM